MERSIIHRYNAKQRKRVTVEIAHGTKLLQRSTFHLSNCQCQTNDGFLLTYAPIIINIGLQFVSLALAYTLIQLDREIADSVRTFRDGLPCAII